MFAACFCDVRGHYNTIRDAIVISLGLPRETPVFHYLVVSSILSATIYEWAGKLVSNFFSFVARALGFRTTSRSELYVQSKKLTEIIRNEGQKITEKIQWTELRILFSLAASGIMILNMIRVMLP